MKRTIRIKYSLCICWALTAILTVFLSARPAQSGSGGGGSAGGAPHQAVLSSPLALFQQVISRADGDRCPMAPSCSHYAATVFEHHHPVAALILTCDRL
jgi:hypothetical protein